MESIFETVSISILSGLVGVFIGHRFALGRDKRIEHNNVIRPLKKKLLISIDELNDGNVHISLNESDIDSIRGWIGEKEYKKVHSLFLEF